MPMTVACCSRRSMTRRSPIPCVGIRIRSRLWPKRISRSTRRGALGARTLTGISTAALEGNDATYARLEASLDRITTQRNQIAGEMIEMLEAAAFEDHPIDRAAAARLIDEAYDLLDSVR